MWEDADVFNADVLAADNADVLAADNADVLAADTTDVLAADKYVADGKLAVGCWLLVGCWYLPRHAGDVPRQASLAQIFEALPKYLKPCPNIWSLAQNFEGFWPT